MVDMRMTMVGGKRVMYVDMSGVPMADAAHILQQVEEGVRKAFPDEDVVILPNHWMAMPFWKRLVSVIKGWRE